MRLNICFFALVIIAPRFANIAGTGPGGSGEADLRNSDATPDPPFLLECRTPANASLDSINVNLTQEERDIVELEGRCFLACATHNQYTNEVKQLTRILILSEYNILLYSTDITDECVNALKLCSC